MMNVKYDAGIIVLLMCLLCICQPTVNAYNLWNWHWPSSAVYPLHYKNYSGLSEVENAKSDWNFATQNYPEFASTTSGEEVDIFSYNDDDGYSGLTYACNTSGDHFVYVQVFLNGYYLTGYSSYKRMSVISHEFGHVWGLNECDAKVLMNPYDDIRYDTHYIYKPQDDDLEGVQYLY